MRNDLASRRSAPVSPANAEPSNKSALVLKVLGGLLLAVLLGWYIKEKFFISEEERVRRVIAEAIAGANDRNPGRVVATLAEEFKGPQGSDKGMVRAVLVQLMMTMYRKVEVKIEPDVPNLDVKVDGANATAEFTVTARGQIEEHASWENILEFSDTGRRFKITLRKDAGKGWLVTECQTQR